MAPEESVTLSTKSVEDEFIRRGRSDSTKSNISIGALQDVLQRTPYPSEAVEPRSTTSSFTFSLAEQHEESHPTNADPEPDNITQDMVHRLLSQLPPEQDEDDLRRPSSRKENQSDNKHMDRLEVPDESSQHAFRFATVNEITLQKKQDRKREREAAERAREASSIKRSRSSEYSNASDITTISSPSVSVHSKPNKGGRTIHKPKNFAHAVKYPSELDMPIGLNRPLLDCLQPGGVELNSLENQKLIDATVLLQELNIHILEPLTLYNKRQLYELMASITEVWKNSGKAAWKKRINKIKGNARSRKAPKNVLDEKELQEIAELEAKIKQREIWEQQEKLKISVLSKQHLDDHAVDINLPNFVPAPNEVPTARKLQRAIPRSGTSPSNGGGPKANKATAKFPHPTTSPVAATSSSSSSSSSNTPFFNLPHV